MTGRCHVKAASETMQDPGLMGTIWEKGRNHELGASGTEARPPAFPALGALVSLPASRRQLWASSSVF